MINNLLSLRVALFLSSYCCITYKNRCYLHHEDPPIIYFISRYMSLLSDCREIFIYHWHCHIISVSLWTIICVQDIRMDTETITAIWQSFSNVFLFHVPSNSILTILKFNLHSLTPHFKHIFKLVLQFVYPCNHQQSIM